MFDVAIVGAGPAGLSAALTLTSLQKNIVWFGVKAMSAKVRSAEKIRNYPGLPDISGREMAEVFAGQAAQMGIEITEKIVTGIYPIGDYFGILCDQESFEAKSVILCTGVEAVKPIPGELEFVGRGVSYCATCDGFLYRDKTIAVVCTSKELENEIEFLASVVKKVYLFPLYKHVEIQAENVEISRKMPLSIEGGMKVQSITLKDGTLEVDGVFMLKQAVTPSVLLYGLGMEEGHITVDRHCCTNIPGVFAAGDCTGKPYQYVKAAGEGNVAAHSAVGFLAK